MNITHEGRNYTLNIQKAIEQNLLIPQTRPISAADFKVGDIVKNIFGGWGAMECVILKVEAQNRITFVITKAFTFGCDVGTVHTASNSWSCLFSIIRDGKEITEI